MKNYAQARNFHLLDEERREIREKACKEVEKMFECENGNKNEGEKILVCTEYF